MTSKRHNTKWGFDARAIHARQEFDPTTGAVIAPIGVLQYLSKHIGHA
jgi:O-acetylhomoserine/O-acetylserine sulfhydrylase-like pyridoxal-dependent enzyme